MSADNLPRQVAGRCPGCGQHSLSVMGGGHVTCRRIGCPRPTAADDLLHDGREQHPGDLSADERQDSIDAAKSVIRRHLAVLIDEPVSPDRMTRILQSVHRALDEGRSDA